MFKICNRNHIQVCYEAKNLAPSEEQVHPEEKCPLCEKEALYKEVNKERIKLIDGKMKLNEEINELQTERVEFKAEIGELKENLANTYLADEITKLKKKIHMFENGLNNVLNNVKDGLNNILNNVKRS